MGAVGTIDQGTQEKSCPVMHWIAGMQTLVPAVTTAVGHKQAPDPFSHNSRAPGKQCLKQLFMKRTAFVEVQFSSLDGLAYHRRKIK